MTNILSTPERKRIKLGEKEYRLSPLNLNVLADIEETFGCSLLKLGRELDKRQAITLRKLIFILLKEEYPDITLIEIGKAITLSNLATVNETLAKVLAAG